MLELFRGVANHFKNKKSYIDNFVFRLHYRTTFCILVISSILVTTSQFVGSPIQCMVDGVPTVIMNTYCWVQGTFTLPSDIVSQVKMKVAHPGVSPHLNYQLTLDQEDPFLNYQLTQDQEDPFLIPVTEEAEEIRHAWYQWVCFVLFLQAIMCYFPHYLWKYFEGGKLRLIIQGMDVPTLTDPDTMKQRRILFVNYFTRHFGTHNFYAWKFFFCEVLNLINILSQIALMDVFLGGQFTTYGMKVLALSSEPFEKREDPMSKIFPKVTKCTFYKYGHTGTVENKDGLCILAQNTLNEKIYIFLWFWFIILAMVTFIHLVVRFLTACCFWLRRLQLYRFCWGMKCKDVSTFIRKCYYGDWFLLYQMSKQIQPAVFEDLMIDLCDSMKGTN